MANFLLQMSGFLKIILGIRVLGLVCILKIKLPRPQWLVPHLH